MNLSITSEQRFAIVSDGSVWAPGPSARSFWDRYLGVFERVHVIARTAYVPEPPEGWKRADGPNITFGSLPYYVGPLKFVLAIPKLRSAMKINATRNAALLMRVGSPLSVLLEPLRRPFGLEVVGDPSDVFAPGAIRHPLRPALRLLSTAQLRSQCRRAAGVSFVTESALQSRYPASPEAFVTSYSSIELLDDSLVSTPRKFTVAPRPLRIVSIGSFEQLYKGFDILVDAFAACVARGFALALTIVGDGRYRPVIQRQAAAHGFADRIRFTGALPSGECVRQELDRSDLFVLASRTEGLPRSMVEAMARGIPCLGSAVGGIPELLAAEYLFPNGDRAILERQIEQAAIDPGWLTTASERNLKKAQNYRHSILNTRRTNFLQQLRHVTAEWLSAGCPQQA